VICFQGANVFERYLNDDKRTAAVKDEQGWFWTGDVGRLDADGFLFIEGRLSRFSKIAGEMVPHEAVEDALLRALQLQGESIRKLAVVGIADAERGEALVLLMACPERQQDMLQLRYELLERGVPALWIPKRMLRVPEIPILSSGKLDAQACEKLAATLVQ
jgi:acyl-[acyl-carrier-protein]-phospholipid O-acyltransferase/long-chain-fatty-acid--[acyl-carrier-protein] ligase